MGPIFILKQLKGLETMHAHLNFMVKGKHTDDVSPDGFVQSETECVF